MIQRGQRVNWCLFCIVKIIDHFSHCFFVVEYSLMLLHCTVVYISLNAQLPICFSFNPVGWKLAICIHVHVVPQIKNKLLLVSISTICWAFPNIITIFIANAPENFYFTQQCHFIYLDDLSSLVRSLFNFLPLLTTHYGIFLTSDSLYFYICQIALKVTQNYKMW